MGKIIAVLGLGESLSLFKKEDFDFTIGVNDIWRKVQTDAVVVLNTAGTFNADRLKWIMDCKPKLFYSQIVNWDFKPGFFKIEFFPGLPERYISLNERKLFKSIYSPFVGIQIAYKYHDAKEIHLFGVDFINHPIIKGDLLASVKRHTAVLKAELEKNGVPLIVHGNGILSR